MVDIQRKVWKYSIDYSQESAYLYIKLEGIQQVQRALYFITVTNFVLKTAEVLKISGVHLACFLLFRLDLHRPFIHVMILEFIRK